MEEYYVLDEHGNPVREMDADAWAQWAEQADRGVARTLIAPGVTVLTIFRGVDEAPEPGVAPQLFDTRVFGGILDGEEISHGTRAQAMDAHASLAAWCRLGNAPDSGLKEETLI